jgi:hypothetical protein
MAVVASLLDPIVRAMFKRVLMSEVVQTDDSVPSEGWHVQWESVPPG